MNIKFKNINQKNSIQLDRLYQKLYENDIEVQLLKEKKISEGNKSVDINTMINIASLSVDSIMMFLTILEYFEKDNNNSISYLHNGKTITLNNLSKEEIKKELEQVSDEDQENLEFLIS